MAILFVVRSIFSKLGAADDSYFPMINKVIDRSVQDVKKLVPSSVSRNANMIRRSKLKLLFIFYRCMVSSRWTFDSHIVYHGIKLLLGSVMSCADAYIVMHRLASHLHITLADGSWLYSDPQSMHYLSALLIFILKHFYYSNIYNNIVCHSMGIYITYFIARVK